MAARFAAGESGDGVGTGGAVSSGGAGVTDGVGVGAGATVPGSVRSGEDFVPVQLNIEASMQTRTTRVMR